MGFDAFLGSGLYGSAAASQGTTSFADDVFRVTDDGEVTAKIAFQASAISSGTTRTILMPDADVDLGSLGGGGGAVVPELYVRITDENGIAGYTNPAASYPQRFGTNTDWLGSKVNLTEYDEFQVRATYDSGDNSGIVLGVGCTSGSAPLNRTNPAFSIGDGQGAPYEYIHSGQLGADAVVSGGVSFDGAAGGDFGEGSWTPLDPSVKREVGIAFLYLEGSGVTAGNRTFTNFHVAFRRNR
jgi:hypothetical protein